MNRPAPQPADFLAFLLSAVYDRSELHPDHLADLRRSGLTDETIRAQKLRTVPPDMIGALLGFEPPRQIRSMLAIPYPDRRGGFLPHVRLKLFPPIDDGDAGHTVKYLQPRGSGARVFFPIASTDLIQGDSPLWVIEGEKKSLAVAQRGLAAVGIAGINCWNARGTRRLHPDFETIPLLGRLVEIVPDSDWQYHPLVRAAVGTLATALASRGARARVVVLPDGVPA
jgi:hypothetical protein